MAAESQQAARASVEDVIRALELEQLGEGRFQGATVAGGGPVIFGGQLAGQAIAAAATVEPQKRVKSVHTVLGRTGKVDSPVTLEVVPLQSGRSVATLSVIASQGDRKLAQSLLLLDVADEDVVRHDVDAPGTGGPEAGVPQREQMTGWEQRYTEDVDLVDPAQVGPAELNIWSRFTTDRSEPWVAQGLLAWASLGPLIGTAMRPHEGVGLAQSHRTLTTGVLSHTLHFHEQFSAGEWLLLALRSPYAGTGRAFGTGDVFGEDGRLVASIAQEALLRKMAESGSAL